MGLYNTICQEGWGSSRPFGSAHCIGAPLANGLLSPPAALRSEAAKRSCRELSRRLLRDAFYPVDSVWDRKPLGFLFRGGVYGGQGGIPGPRILSFAPGCIRQVRNLGIQGHGVCQLSLNQNPKGLGRTQHWQRACQVVSRSSVTHTGPGST